MQKKALVVIDIQNDITQNYKQVIGAINMAIDWATANGVYVIYIRHETVTPVARLFKPNTRGAEFAADMKVVSKNIFTKHKSNALTSEEFVNFIKQNEINEFYLAGADAGICVKSTCFNMLKSGYTVSVLSDCISGWNMKKNPAMLDYYQKQGAKICGLRDL